MTLFGGAGILIPRLGPVTLSFLRATVRVNVPCSEVHGSVHIKAGDLSPALTVLLEEEDGTPFSLSGWTLPKFYLRNAINGSTLTLDGATATIEGDGSTGAITYTWVSGDTDTAADYLAEFEAVDTLGSVRRFPSDGYIHVRILPAL